MRLCAGQWVCQQIVINVYIMLAGQGQHTFTLIVHQCHPDLHSPVLWVASVACWCVAHCWRGYKHNVTYTSFLSYIWNSVKGRLTICINFTLHVCALFLVKWTKFGYDVLFMASVDRWGRVVLLSAGKALKLILKVDQTCMLVGLVSVWLFCAKLYKAD